MSKKNWRILFVDDEPYFVKRYVDVLDKRYTLIYVQEVLPALDSVTNHGNELKAIVLDIMMPIPKEIRDKDSLSELETGIWLLELLQRGDHQFWPIPVLILTNRRPDIIIESLDKRNIDRNLIEVHHKLATPANTLPGKLENLINKNQQGGSD